MPSSPILARRGFLGLAGSAALAGLARVRLVGADANPPPAARGAIVGDSGAAAVGRTVLAGGGNAIDAAIAAAFAAGIVSPHNCGVGGYGGHAVIALAGSGKVTTIDFNSTAPARARADMFPCDAAGKVTGNVNTIGWLAAGVPGTLAGLELILRRYGTRSLRATLEPAIALCESGRHVAAVKGLDDEPPPPGSAPLTAALPQAKQRNFALARFLRTLAARDSADSFYRGDLADIVADAFARFGGLVTRADLAAYQARELPPTAVEWNGAILHTAPLTASGPLVLEAMLALRSLKWERLSEAARVHAKVEALRIAWADRLATWGDPDHVAVPVERFLSPAHAEASAALIATALEQKRPVPLRVQPSLAGGTTHLSAADRHGNLIALTLTHGGGFGARVCVPELGVVLGHGMSRFDPRPGFPNSPGPGKRPITNMCPTIVTRQGTPVLALGGAGGTRIPSSLYEVLLNVVGLGRPLPEALAAPRIHTDGTTRLALPPKFPAQPAAELRTLGYETVPGPAALISAVSFDPRTRESAGLSVREG